eukprot:1187354-Karenia_brevis.AAC.1
MHPQQWSEPAWWPSSMQRPCPPHFRLWTLHCWPQAHRGGAAVATAVAVATARAAVSGAAAGP